MIIWFYGFKYSYQVQIISKQIYMADTWNSNWYNHSRYECTIV